MAQFIFFPFSIFFALPFLTWYQEVGSWIRTRDLAMEQRTLKIINNCLNTNIYSYLETSGGQSYNLYLNVVHFFQH